MIFNYNPLSNDSLFRAISRVVEANRVGCHRVRELDSTTLHSSSCQRVIENPRRSASGSAAPRENEGPERSNATEGSSGLFKRMCTLPLFYSERIFWIDSCQLRLLLLGSPALSNNLLGRMCGFVGSRSFWV